MNQPDNDASRLGDRVTELESSIMHFQRDYEALNEVVLEMSNRIERMSLLIERLSRRIESSSEPEAPRSLEDEKPPHY